MNSISRVSTDAISQLNVTGTLPDEFNPEKR